jgi:hypothetical protein
MSNMELYERGIARKPNNYEIFKMFSPHAYYGKAQGNDGADTDSKGGRDLKMKDAQIVAKLHQRFPSLKMMPVVMFMQFQKHGDRDNVHSHPAISFV